MNGTQHVNVGLVFVGKKNRSCLDEHFRGLSGLSPLIDGFEKISANKTFDRLVSCISHLFRGLAFAALLWEAHFPEGMVKEICEDWFVESSICGGDFW